MFVAVLVFVFHEFCLLICVAFSGCFCVRLCDCGRAFVCCVVYIGVLGLWLVTYFVVSKLLVVWLFV